MKNFRKNTSGKGVPALLIAFLLICLVGSVMFGVAVWTGVVEVGTDDGSGLRIIGDGGDSDGVIDDQTGMVDVNRPIKISVKNAFTKAAGTSLGIVVYDSTGKNQVDAGTTDGTTGEVTLDPFSSGTELVIEISHTNAPVRYRVTVPQMHPADVDVLSTNEINLESFTVPGADVTVAVTPASTGTALADGGDWNKTVSGNTDTLTIAWTLPTDNEGFISSYDEVDGLNWNAVLYCKLYSTNYELVSLSGWDGSYAKGTATWYWKLIQDTAVTKYKVGNSYVYSGAGSFTHTIDATGYSGDAADLEYYMYVDTDPAYHETKGSFGPDAYAIFTSSPFTVDLVD
jgi:hypothetical protein